MKEKKLYIGLDVHKDSIRCGIAWEGRDDPEVYAKWGGANLSVERGLNRPKCGNGHARWMLTECASHYRYEATGLAIL